MKKVYSIMLALVFVVALALPGFAVDKKEDKKGGQSDYKPKGDQPEPRPKEPNDPNIYIKLGCKAESQGVQYGIALNEVSSWYYHGIIINTTGQVIPKGAKIEYSFSSSKPGYFQTNAGGVPKINGTVILNSPLANNAELYVTGLTFKTTKNPAQVNGSAVYVKKKK